MVNDTPYLIVTIDLYEIDSQIQTGFKEKYPAQCYTIGQDRSIYLLTVMQYDKVT